MPVSAWLLLPGAEPQAVAAPAGAIDAAERALLDEVLTTGVSAGGAPRPEAEAAYLFLPVRTPKRVHGALGIRLPATEAGSLPEVKATLETGANQIAIALDQAQAREEADAARTQAEGERLRSALLSAVSHDLRTPLTGIVGAAGSLAEGAEVLDVATRRELAQGIEEEAERLNRLVTNLLHATRLDAGGAQLHREWTPLEEVVAPALARLERVLGDHAVELDLPADLPLVYVDPVMLEQVFINLLENASKYTPAGTRVFVRARRMADALAVEVEDEGPGLPEGEETRAFDKFRRYHQGGAPGAGLGLAIVRGVVEAHAGTISAANRPGGGAVFRFTLPLGRALVE
ncbi:Sensor protein KdpD [compost metagenome]